MRRPSSACSNPTPTTATILFVQPALLWIPRAQVRESMSKDGSLALSVRLARTEVRHHILQEEQGQWWLGACCGETANIDVGRRTSADGHCKAVRIGAGLLIGVFHVWSRHAGADQCCQREGASAAAVPFPQEPFVRVTSHHTQRMQWRDRRASGAARTWTRPKTSASTAAPAFAQHARKSAASPTQSLDSCVGGYVAVDPLFRM